MYRIFLKIKVYLLAKTLERESLYRFLYRNNLEFAELYDELKRLDNKHNTNHK